MVKQGKIYSLDKTGAYGNQLAFMVHCLAVAKEYNLELHSSSNPAFFSPFPLLNLQVKWISQKGLRLFFKYILPGLNILIGGRYISLFNKVFIINCRIDSNHQLVQKLKKVDRPVLITTDWSMRAKDLVDKHQDYIRKLFCDYSVLPLTGDFKKSIGVHVRRGDYRNWQNGKYFYEVSRYYNEMLSLADNFGPSICFHVFSNEDIRFNNTEGLTIIYEKGDFHGDHLKMQAMDVLLGPPSTYSGTASFLANKPLFVILPDEIQKHEVYDV
ncbi:MAG: hypothetical protein ACXWV4_10840 [Flavitalea sp.]